MMIMMISGHEEFKETLIKKSNTGMANKAREVCWLLLVPFSLSVYISFIMLPQFVPAT